MIRWTLCASPELRGIHLAGEGKGAEAEALQALEPLFDEGGEFLQEAELKRSEGERLPLLKGGAGLVYCLIEEIGQGPAADFGIKGCLFQLFSHGIEGGAVSLSPSLSPLPWHSGQAPLCEEGNRPLAEGEISARNRGSSTPR